MKDLSKMSIEELRDLLSKITDPSSASPAEAVLQSKSILFLSSELAVFKETLSNNANMFNTTIGITNKSIKELRDSVNDSTGKIIDSNRKLADSQNINSRIMVILNVLLVTAAIFQASIMSQQTKIMNWHLDKDKRNENTQRIASWSELRNAMWEIIDETTVSGSGIKTFTSLPKTDRQERLQKVLAILLNNEENPTLIECSTCLKEWRSAIDSAKLCSGSLLSLEDPQGKQLFEEHISRIMGKTFLIWKKLVLDTNFGKDFGKVYSQDIP